MARIATGIQIFMGEFQWTDAKRVPLLVQQSGCRGLVPARIAKMKRWKSRSLETDHA